MTKKDLELKKAKIFEILREKNIFMSSCESYTGGGFANEITNTKGSSEVFAGALITYTNTTKIKLAKVKKRVIKKYGAISQQCAEEMAFKGSKVMKTNVCVSFTGNADKNVSENKKPFMGYISIYYLGLLESYQFDLSDKKDMTREKFKKASIEFAIEKILGILS